MLNEKKSAMMVELNDLKRPTVRFDDTLKSPHQRQSRRHRSSRFSRLSRLSVHDVKSALHFIRESWKSGLSQSLLTMPFAMNAGFISGCNASVGVTTAFIGAFMNGLFSGSNHSIYVPNQTASGFYYGIQSTYGIEALPWVTLFIGIIVYLSSLLKWHHLIEFLPSFAIEGYFLGLGFLVMNNYIDYAFGLTDNHTSRSPYLNKIQAYQAYIERGDLLHFAASICVYLYLYIGNKYSRPFPWVLTTTCFGIFIGVLFPTERCLRSVYGSAGLQFGTLELDGHKFHFTFSTCCDLIQEAAPLALLLTIQNLICAKGAETLTGVKCDVDQEAISISVANIMSGLCGCLPCNAQQRLYTLNIKVREINQWSSIINSVSVLIFYGLFSKQFLEIPLFVISGQILFSAYQCPTWSYVDRIIATRRHLTIFKCTVIAVLCVYYGVIQSTIIGSLYALLKFAENMSAAASEVILQSPQPVIQSKMVKQENGEDLERSHQEIQDDLPTDQEYYLLYRFNGSINYINVRNHIEQIKSLPDSEVLVFSFRYVSVFDEQAIDRLAVIFENMIKSGRELYFTGLHQSMIDQLKFSKFFQDFLEYRPNKVKLLGCHNHYSQ